MRLIRYCREHDITHRVESPDLLTVTVWDAQRYPCVVVEGRRCEPTFIGPSGQLYDDARKPL